MPLALTSSISQPLLPLRSSLFMEGTRRHGNRWAALSSLVGSRYFSPLEEPSKHSFLFKWGRIPSRGRLCVSAKGRDGCEPQGCVRGLPGVSAQPRSPPRATGAHPQVGRASGPQAPPSSPGSQRGRASGGPVDREPASISPALHRRGSAHRAWRGCSKELWVGKAPCRETQGHLPIVHTPGPPLLSASNSAAKSSRLCGPNVHSTCFAAAPPRSGGGEGRVEGRRRGQGRRRGEGKQGSFADWAHFRPHQRQQGGCGELHLSPPLAVSHLLDRNATSYAMCCGGHVDAVQRDLPWKCSGVGEPSLLTPAFPGTFCSKQTQTLYLSRDVMALDLFHGLGGRNSKGKTKK